MRNFSKIFFLFAIIGTQLVNAQYFVTIGADLDLQPKQIAINEVLANPAGTDTGNEWIELYNYSEESVSLAGWTMKDTSTTTFIFEDIEMLPGEFLLIYPNFSLNQSNETITLFDKLENIVDTFSYDSSSEDLSWARLPDGIGDWTANQIPTIGVTNAIEEISYPDTVLISEIYPTPANEEEEWLEIFNNSEEELSLDGWMIDDLANSVILKDFILAPFSYLQITASDLGSVTLNNSGDTISLLNPNGEIIYEFTYLKTSTSLSNILYENSIVQTKAVTPAEENIYVGPEDCFYDALPISIKDFKSTSIESEVYFKLDGLVTALPGEIYTGKIYIQDATGGILISFPSDYQTNFLIGEEISVCGYHDEYYSEDEFILANTNALIKTGNGSEPAVTTIQTATQRFVGSLVLIKGEIVENSSSSITIQTLEEQIKVKLSHISLSQEKSKGDTAEIRGILTRYGDTNDGLPNYRVVPRNEGDIEIIPKAEPSKATTTTKTQKSSTKSATSVKSVLGASRNEVGKVELKNPSFQELKKDGIELGLKIEQQKSNQSELRAVSASGFLISSSSLFMLFGKRNNV